jgi:4a-hydroxytetrahydrobiopterin dehydratase
VAIPENETRLDASALRTLLGNGTGWRREGDALTKTFTFKGFKAAMAFANRVGDAANAANHHPDIHVEGYKNVRIVLTTHAAGAVTDADVALAKEIDKAERG